MLRKSLLFYLKLALKLNLKTGLPLVLYVDKKIFVRDFNEDDWWFGKTENVIFRIKALYLIRWKMETFAFNVEFNTYEVLGIVFCNSSKYSIA